MHRLAAQLYTQLVIQQVAVVVVVVHDRKLQLALHIAYGRKALVTASHIVLQDYGRMALAKAYLRMDDSQPDVLHVV
jgi:hypothetical protein